MPPRQTKATTETVQSKQVAPVVAPVVASTAPPSRRTKSTPAPAVSVPEPVAEPVVEPVVVPPTSTRRTKSVPAPQPPVVKEEPVAEPDHHDDAEDPQEDGKTEKRHACTPESVQAGFTEMISQLEASIKTSDKVTAKLLKGFLRQVRLLQTASLKLLKRRQPSTKRVANTNSGFLKPVPISSEIAQFTGLDPSALHSRVDVTKYLCNYIKDHDLQNPDDRRQIKADPALTKLLKYSTASDKPLTYYHMQSLLKPHFTK